MIPGGARLCRPWTRSLRAIIRRRRFSDSRPTERGRTGKETKRKGASSVLGPRHYETNTVWGPRKRARADAHAKARARTDARTRTRTHARSCAELSPRLHVFGCGPLLDGLSVAMSSSSFVGVRRAPDPETRSARRHGCFGHTARVAMFPSSRAVCTSGDPLKMKWRRRLLHDLTLPISTSTVERLLSVSVMYNNRFAVIVWDVSEPLSRIPIS